MAEPANNGENEKSVLSCYVCKEQYSKENMPILLTCLHTICDHCTHKQQSNDLTADLIEKDVIECPSCKGKTRTDEILLNYLIVHTFNNKPNADCSETEEATCTACEENESAANFCTNCCEWLCVACTQAHKRVRVTKDHEIIDKSMAEKKTKDVSAKELMKCSVHPQEDLKLFCETCDKLTCRDCQLQEHREHKHHFVTEAIEQTKKMLTSLRAALKKKSSDLANFKIKTETQLENANEQEKQLSENVNQIFSTMKREIDKKEQQILSDLHEIWSKQTNKIKQSNEDCVNLGVVLNHCTEFVDTIINNGSNLFALYTKSSILKHAQKILSKAVSPCPEPIEVRYKHNIKVMLQNMNYLGHLSKNGVVVGQPANATISQMQQQQLQQQQQQGTGGAETSRQILLRMLKHLPVEQHKPFLEALRASSDYDRQVSSASSHHQTVLQHPSLHNKAVPANMVVNHIRPPMYPHAMTHKMGNHVNHLRQPVNTMGNMSQLRMEVQKPPIGYSDLQLRIRLEQQSRLQLAQKYQQSMTMQTIPMNVANPGSPIESRLAHQGLRPSMRASTPNHIVDQKPVIPSWTIPADNHAKIPETSPVMMRRLSATGSEVSPQRSPQSNPSCEGGSRPSSRDSSITVKQEMSQNGGASSCSFRSVPSVDIYKDKSVDQDHLEAAMLSVPIMSDGSSFQPCTTPERPASGDPGGSATPPIQPPPSRYGAASDENSDPSEDYCACCHNGGDLLCCDRCPKVYHLTCHIPNLDSTPQGSWTCMLCEPIDDLRVETPFSHDATDCNKRKAPVGLNDHEMKVCERLLLELYCHESSMPFHLPVSKTVVPDYYKVITRPMDFSKIKSKLTRQHFNHYTTVEDFLGDVLLVYSNCLWYNGSQSEVGVAGVAMNAFTKSLVARFLPCYSDHITEVALATSCRHSTVSPDHSQPKRRRSPLVKEEVGEGGEEEEVAEEGVA